MSAKPDSIRTIYDLLGERLFSMAGIELHTMKTRTWSRTGVPRLRVGARSVGTPVCNDEFVQRLSEERIGKEEHLWRAMAWVPDLQCACISFFNVLVPGVTIT